MIEKTILDYLDGELSVPVLMEQPEVPDSYTNIPTEYVLIERVGGSKSNQVSSASFAVQSYSASLYEAAALDEEVREAMDGILELDDIASCRLASNYNFTNTATKQYRYQSVFDITHY